MHQLSIASFCFGAALSLPAAQDPTPDAVPRPAASAALIAAAKDLWQCEPIRCSLEVKAANGAVYVRPAAPAAADPLVPWQVERFHDDHWEAVRVATREREHPASRLTPPRGRRIEPKDGFLFELELWHLDVVSKPGRIRVRCQLEERDARDEKAPFTALATPWLEFEIHAHAANAALLLGETAELRTAYETFARGLNSTETVARNSGPFNPGPGAVAFATHVPTAERLLADPKVSWRLRARARLVLAYNAVDNAGRTAGPDREEHLRKAREHLDADEMIASPPSGGLEALPSGGLLVLRQMLVACVDGLEGRGDPAVALRELRERHPFFAMWWRAEAAALLRARR